MEEDYYDFEGASVQESPRFDPAILDEFSSKKVDWNRVNQIVGMVQRQKSYAAQQDAMRRKAEAEAIRYAGMQEFQSLVSAGTTPAEAARRVGSKLFYGQPKQMIDFERSIAPTPQPRLDEIDGLDFVNWGNGRYSLPPKKETAPPFKANPALSITGEAEYKSAMKGYEDALKGTKVDGKIVQDPALVGPAARRLRLAEENLKKIHSPPGEEKEITKEIAADFVRQAKGDKDLARKMAREAGYSLKAK